MEAPVEIQTVKGNVNVVVCNKNLFKKTAIERKGYSSGVVGANINKIASTTRLTSEEILVKPNTTYSFTLGTEKTLRYNIFEIDKDNIIVNINAVTDNSNKTITTGASTKKISTMMLWQITTDEITLNDIADCRIQLVEGELGDFVEHEEQNYTVDIQEEMLEGDYFDLENGKEVHSWLKLVLDGTNNVVVQATTSTEGKYRYQYPIYGNLKKGVMDCSKTEAKAYCSHLSMASKNTTYALYKGFTTSSSILYIYTDGATANEFNEHLKTNPMTFYIPLKEGYYNKLNLTDNQKTQLEALKKAKTYKNITNIYSTDEVGAIIKIDYKKDLETLVNNINNTLLGGN